MVLHFHNLKSKDHLYIWRSKAPNVSLVKVYKAKPLCVLADMRVRQGFPLEHLPRVRAVTSGQQLQMRSAPQGRDLVFIL